MRSVRGGGRGAVRRIGRIILAMTGLTLLQPGPPATASIFGGAPTPALNYCAAERAPLVAIDKQFSDAEHSRIYKSLGVGVAALSGGLLASVLANRLGGSQGPAVNNTQLTYAVLAGLAASVGTYLTLKAQAGVQDRRALAMSIDTDAGQQLQNARYAQQEAVALTACRQRQLQDFQQRAAAAGGQASALAREKQQIVAAVREDIGLTNRVVGRQADLAKTFTEARAMAEGQTEAKVLGSQKAAFTLPTETTPPLLPSSSVFATQPPPTGATPTERTVVTTLRPTPVRDTPSNKGKLLETLPARHEITPPTGFNATPPPEGWTAVDVDGQTGYTRAAYLSGPRTITTPGVGLAPASNVRAYNQVVLESRDEGPDRMKSLLTNFQ